MLGVLEDGDRLATQEEKANFVEKMFDISMAAPEMLVLYNPVSVEDFEMCIEILQAMKDSAERMINGSLKRGGKNDISRQ